MLSASCIIVILFVTLPRTNGHELYVHLPILISAIGITWLSISSTDKILWSNYNALLQLQEERKKLKGIQERLQMADSMKGKLISIITHDLKGPNNNIISMLDLLLSRSISMDEFHDLTEKVRNQIKSNHLLLESLLKWSVLQRENKRNYTKISIRELVNEGIELVQHMARQKGNRLINNVDNSIIISDPEIIRMSLRNLLTNAIKYTENGTITFYNKFSPDNEFLLSIQDTGIGMTQEFASSLFNWNSRRTTPGTNEEKGTGIGLLMCSEYLQNIGASLKIYSTPNIGTCITIVVKMTGLETPMLKMPILETPMLDARMLLN
jgi:signal transduction histidine kinase